MEFKKSSLWQSTDDFASYVRSLMLMRSIVFFKKNTKVHKISMATVVLVFAGFYGPENMWMEVNQE